MLRAGPSLPTTTAQSIWNCPPRHAKMFPMNASGAQLVESLRDTLECPACSYSLRGLGRGGGDDIICPECGAAVNVPRLIAQRWTRPWWEAPLYNTIALPLAWAFLMFIGVVVTFAYVETSGIRNGHIVIVAAFGVALLSWIGWLHFVARKFGSNEAIGLACLVHLVLPAYVGGIAFMIGGFATLMGSAGQQRWWMLPFNAIFMLMGVLAIFAGRWIERFVARRCIRRHLRLSAAGRSGIATDKNG